MHAENDNLHLFYNTPTVIVISGEKSSIVPHIDCAATQKMLIAVKSINTGSCLINLVTKLFKSEKNHRIWKTA